MFENRIKSLNDKPINKKSDRIIYWMQRSVRTEYNHALEYAIQMSNDLKKDLLVVFSLDTKYPEANERSFYFLLESLKDVKQNLEKSGIKFIVLDSSPIIKKLLDIGKDASCIITDRAYLSGLINIRSELAQKTSVRVIQVESDVVIPVETASNKEEYSAKTIRGKIHKIWNYYINKEFTHTHYEGKFLDGKKSDFDLDNIDRIMENLDIDKSVKKSVLFYGGENKANELLDLFISEKLDGYNTYRNHPELDYQSDLSPYLHFGNISSLFIAKKVLNSGKNSESSDAFLEELVIRRELAVNFVYYNKNYDNFENMTYSWAYETMKVHKDDMREYIYSVDELENSETHDIYWNAAQNEMVLTGKMHGYMRMYWAKKIIEWSDDYKNAYETIKYLNNKYFLDGRDENGYAGIAWCFGKHDRAWFQREIFGKLRYMNSNGLKSKFDIEEYVRKIEGLRVELI